MRYKILIFHVFYFLTLTSHAQNTQTIAPAAPQDAPPTLAIEWKPKLNWLGDIRTRIDRTEESSDDARFRSLLRVRLGVKADVNERTLAVLRLATISAPNSTNYTQGDANGLTQHGVGVDQAYADWMAFGSAHLWLGRTANPFWSPAKVQTIFDSDLSFEGVAFKWEPTWDHSSLFVNVGTSWISEQYTAASATAAGVDSPDVGLVGLETGYSLKTDVAGTWTIHAGYYGFLNLQGKLITTVGGSATSTIDPQYYTGTGNYRFRGNTVRQLGTAPNFTYEISNNFNVAEVGAEWKKSLGSFDGVVFLDYAKNTSVSSQDSAYEGGVSVKHGSLTGALAYVVKEADSVFGIIADSDTGAGGTDYRSTRASLAYQFDRNVSITLTDFRGQRNVSTNSHNFSKDMLDFVATF